MTTRTQVVVPCYNEASRLRPELFEELARVDGFTVLFVDDGSTDRTPLILENLCAEMPDRFAMKRLARNSGKAEAVRAGLQEAIQSGADEVGYLDADCATLPIEMTHLRTELITRGYQIALGSRVRLLGRDIDRRAFRHYVGRVFATYISFVLLRMPVYDTQCGAKLFRVSEPLRRALRKPFRTNWVFDVELIQRLLTGPNALSRTDFVEVPLSRWSDVSGSKIRLHDTFRIMWDLARLTLDAVRKRTDTAGL